MPRWDPSGHSLAVLARGPCFTATQLQNCFDRLKILISIRGTQAQKNMQIRKTYAPKIESQNPRAIIFVTKGPRPGQFSDFAPTPIQKSFAPKPTYRILHITCADHSAVMIASPPCERAKYLARTSGNRRLRVVELWHGQQLPRKLPRNHFQRSSGTSSQQPRFHVVCGKIPRT